jgi:hypothetical protein
LRHPGFEPGTSAWQSDCTPTIPSRQVIKSIKN